MSTKIGCHRVNLLLKKIFYKNNLPPKEKNIHNKTFEVTVYFNLTCAYNSKKTPVELDGAVIAEAARRAGIEKSTMKGWRLSFYFRL
jgi:hypothetical protein